jgi:anaerobic selenocysteine-containing dehydrogenase
LPKYRAPDETPGVDHETSYPLYILTPNTKNRIHSQFGNLSTIRELDPIIQVEMSPVDAAARGISDGDRVRVFNGRGSIELDARLDYSLRPGCISFHNGWWISEGGGVNLLSAARETDMGHGAAFHDNAVEVEAVE